MVTLSIYIEYLFASNIVYSTLNLGIFHYKFNTLMAELIYAPGLRINVPEIYPVTRRIHV